MDEEGTIRHLLAPTPEFLASIKVFPLIPSIKKDVIANIDTALSWDQLTASDINFAIVRPLVFKYAKIDNMAVVYACFVVRSHFLSEAAENLAYSGVMLSRANLCEILAMKLLGYFSSNQLRLISVLLSCWDPLAGAPAHVIDEVRSVIGGNNEQQDPQCALEMAIMTEAKLFISSPVVQTVVNDIYSGHVVFSMTSYHSVLADNYKTHAIQIYDSRNAPFLDHYRLRVPKYSAIMEALNFALLLLFFVMCLSSQDLETMNIFEVIFIGFAAAFVLEEYTASKEHGWTIYIANLWNVFDSAFVFIFLAYLGLRTKGLVYHDEDTSQLGFDILACGACVLFPRLAFFAVSNNVIVLALRAMVADFIFFIGIAAICFSGLLFTLHNLASDTWSVKKIAWLMIQIWFGNTYLSFAQAESFHPVFGPILMTGFAALSNTLLLTILISILSNTFARIDANANQEYLFQYAISTIEGVKSDALFSYQPPFNLLAFLILWPLSFVLTPRALHTINVFLIRTTSFPILIIISTYERYFARGQKWRENSSDAAHKLYNSISRKMKNMPILEYLVGTNSGDVFDAIFDVEFSQEHELFSDPGGSDNDGDTPVLRSVASHPSISVSMESLATNPQSHVRATLLRTPTRNESVRHPGSSSMSPRLRPPRLSQASAAEIPTTIGQPLSPLGRLFSTRGLDAPAGTQMERVASGMAGTEAGMKRVEGLLEEIRGMPVNRLKEEMIELQDRQARIENLLLMLTRGMRNDTGVASTIRHDTM